MSTGSKGIVCCHACGTVNDEGSLVSRGATCGQCGRPLRCCRNCTRFAPGHSNDCNEPAAEFVGDKDKGNFCDWFTPIAQRTGPITDPAAAAKARLEALFGKKG